MTEPFEFKICNCEESQYLRQVLGSIMDYIEKRNSIASQYILSYNEAIAGFQIENYITALGEALRIRSDNAAMEGQSGSNKEGKNSGKA